MRILHFFIVWCTLAGLAGAVLGYLGYRAKDSAPETTEKDGRHTASTITDDALDALYTRIAQAEDLLGVANETSNTSEAARALAVERAELAERAAAALLDRSDALSLALFDTANYIRGTGQMYPAERRLLDQAVEAQQWREPSWRCPVCDGSVPYHQRHEHLTAEAEQRAEQAAAERDKACLAFNAKVIALEETEAAIARVRAAHLETADGRCAWCFVSWPCPDICRLDGPPGCRNCGENHTPITDRPLEP
ncbi:hypothetical protein [Streptomyces erythrochromogenes]|uniref:hypothetical protein n=1 Tax=Streptomyces erythrochromogenes TaxID=285574 RepID=UPI0036CF6697